MAADSRISGKKIVPLLFAGAALLALIVFLVGVREKHKRRSEIQHSAPHSTVEQ
jgi:hypothetical protein